jgi:hypothetical protein
MKPQGRHLQLLNFKEKALITELIEINHAKKSAKEFIIHQASLFTIKLTMNKIFKKSDLCPFLSIEEQGTSKTIKMKIKKGN